MPAERTRIMGVLRLDAADRAGSLARGVAMIGEGVDIVSVPHTIDATPRRERLMLEAVGELSRLGSAVCVETADAGVALLAAQRGATIVHDMTGASDIFMPRVVREAGLTLIAGCPAVAESDVPLDTAIRERVDQLRELGIPPAQLAIEPSFGGIDASESWRPLLELARNRFVAAPLLIGASRSSLLAALLPEGASAEDHEAASVVVSILAARAEAWAVRVHNVARTRAALRAPAPRFPMGGPTLSEPYAPKEEPAWTTT